MGIALRDVKRPDQFDEYYASKGIVSEADKIKSLTADMGILSTRCEGEETEAEVLAGLQELAILGYWKDFALTATENPTA